MARRRAAARRPGTGARRRSAAAAGDSLSPADIARILYNQVTQGQLGSPPLSLSEENADAVAEELRRIEDWTLACSTSDAIKAISTLRGQGTPNVVAHVLYTVVHQGAKVSLAPAARSAKELARDMIRDISLKRLHVRPTMDTTQPK